MLISEEKNNSCSYDEINYVLKRLKLEKKNILPSIPNPIKLQLKTLSSEEEIRKTFPFLNELQIKEALTINEFNIEKTKEYLLNFEINNHNKSNIQNENINIIKEIFYKIKEIYYGL